MNQEIQDLHLEIKGCSLCHLLTAKKFGLSSHGNHGSRVMLVSEAPGKDSIDKEKMWSGVSGLKIRKVFGDLEETFYMTDLVKCLPPGNRKPTRDEILNCREHLRREIEILDPTVILALGKTALNQLFSLFEHAVGKRVKMKDYHARTDIFVGERGINSFPSIIHRGKTGGCPVTLPISERFSRK